MQGKDIGKFATRHLRESFRFHLGRKSEDADKCIPCRFVHPDDIDEIHHAGLDLSSKLGISGGILQLANRSFYRLAFKVYVQQTFYHGIYDTPARNSIRISFHALHQKTYHVHGPSGITMHYPA